MREIVFEKPRGLNQTAAARLKNGSNSQSQDPSGLDIVSNEEKVRLDDVLPYRLALGIRGGWQQDSRTTILELL